jgi:hypothetical protein
MVSVIMYKLFHVFKALFQSTWLFPFPFHFPSPFFCSFACVGSDKPCKSYVTHLILVYKVMLTVVTMVATNQFLRDCVYLRTTTKTAHHNLLGWNHIFSTKFQWKCLFLSFCGVSLINLVQYGINGHFVECCCIESCHKQKSPSQWHLSITPFWLIMPPYHFPLL